MSKSRDTLITSVKEASRDRPYFDVYEELLDRVQNIQRQYPNEASIPKDNEFWELKEKLFLLVELKLKGELVTKERDIPVVKSTFRNQKLGSVKHEANPGRNPEDERSTIEELREDGQQSPKIPNSME